jgi:hypothetical protein
MQSGYARRFPPTDQPLHIPKSLGKLTGLSLWKAWETNRRTQIGSDHWRRFDVTFISIAAPCTMMSRHTRNEAKL